MLQFVPAYELLVPPVPANVSYRWMNIFDIAGYASYSTFLALVFFSVNDMNQRLKYSNILDIAFSFLGQLRPLYVRMMYLQVHIMITFVIIIIIIIVSILFCSLPCIRRLYFP